MSKKIFIVAGDASGDVYGAQLISSLREMLPSVHIAGFGGDRMEATGMEFLYHLVKEFSVVGFLPVILGMPKVMRFLDIALDYIDAHRPDAVVLIDYPGFNLYLATHLKKRKIPIVYYVTPQIWAWASWRIHKIKRYIDKMLVIFPFEVDFYRRAGVPVEYVGHPLLDRMAHFEPDHSFFHRHRLAEGKILAILPGSRSGEIALNLPLMLWMAEELAKKHHIAQICLPLASSKYHSLASEIIRKYRGISLPEIRLIEHDTYNTIHYSHLVLVTSGTATLETAMLGKPMMVLYRVRSYHKWIVEHTPFLQCDYFALPNIIAGSKIVPEHLVCEPRPEYLREELWGLWEDTAQRRESIQNLASLREKLERPGASARAAKAVMEFLTSRQS